MKYWIPVAVLLLSVPAAHAQEWGSGGAYMGVGLGQLSYKERSDVFSISDSTSTYRLFGGYRFNQNFAVEGSWAASGDIKESYSFDDETVNVKADFNVMTVRAVGMLPLDKMGIFGGVGYYDADTKVRVAVPGLGSGSGKASMDGATLIGGLTFDLGRISLRAEYEWFDTDSGVDMSTYGLGMLFRF